jgi:cysteine-rich repeat protein
MRTLGVILALSTAACGNLLGLDDPRLTDGGSADPTDAMVDAPADTITGRIYTRLSTAAGTRDVPTDATALTIRALLPAAVESGYQVVTGAGRADGTFTIAGVPPGTTYLLNLGTFYYATAARTLDQHAELPGRNDAVAATAPTPVTFNLSRMTRFNGGSDQDTFDTLEIDSFNIGYTATLEGVHRATSVTAVHDWRDGADFIFGNGPVLPVGDALHVLHLRNERFTIGSGRRPFMTRILDWYDGGNVTFVDGVAATVSDGFVVVPQDRTFTVQLLQRSAYDVSFNGTAERQALSLSLTATPVPSDFGLATVLLLDFDDWSRTTNTSVNTAVTYGDPFPAAWPRFLAENYQVFRRLLLPGTTTSRINLGGVFRTRAAPAGIPSLAPTLAPPGTPRIGGLDLTLGGKLAFDGRAPVMATWSAVVGARLYRVDVLRLFANGVQTRSQTAATLFTTETSLAIPAEVFSGGEFFSFRIASIQSPADYGAGMLVANGVPRVTAMVPGGVFRLNTTCGNNVIDPGEDCDTGGESATCDVDCSTRLCGDGLRNATAGEACDTVLNTPSCDLDCTQPLCGDGRVNPQLEDCDDGNVTSDGNGCSVDCKFNNSCGNSVREALAEACDTGGNSATCDADCTPTDCGDGLVNPMANEQCDQGPFNGVAGSGCTLDCQPM